MAILVRCLAMRRLRRRMAFHSLVQARIHSSFHRMGLDKASSSRIIPAVHRAVFMLLLPLLILANLFAAAPAAGSGVSPLVREGAECLVSQVELERWPESLPDVGGPIATQQYSVQNLGEPQGPSNRYDQVGGITPTYDQRGNTTFDGNLFYVYDDQNRLTEVYTLVGSGGGQAGGESMASRSAEAGTLEPSSRERSVVSNLGALERAAQHPGAGDRWPG